MHIPGQEQVQKEEQSLSASMLASLKALSGAWKINFVSWPHE